MIKRILQFLFMLTICISAHSQAVEYNAIATAYVTTTISQNVVFNSTMQAGGTFTFSVLAHNGGGRAGQSDTANVKIEFYNSSGGLITQAATAYNANLPNPNAVCGNPCIDTSVPWSTLTISSTLTAAEAATVAYAKVSMYGVDGSFWAGDYGPWYRAPTFQHNGGGNLTYNPEFGPYNGITAQGWTSNPGFGACQGAWGGSNACIVNSDGVPGTSTVGLVANANGGGPSLTGGTTSGTAGGYNNTMTVTNAGTGATAGAAPAAPTVTGTAVTYTTRNVVSGNTTTVYRTPVTTTTYSDGTTTSANGTEVVYQTRVASNVVTTKIVNGVLTTTTTPVVKVTTSGVTTVESNGIATTTTQNVLQGLNYKVYDFDAYTYSCGIFGCLKNLLGPYRVPSLSAGAYNQVASGRTTNGIYVPTNGSFPAMGEGTLVAYTGTITAPITGLHPAGTVYRLYFYSNSDDGFVLDVNGQRVIDDQSTNQWQSVFGYTSSGWIDVVAGQTYNLDAWYWQDLGSYGMKFYWDYGAGRMTVPNSAFTTGRIVETNTIDTSGVLYGNTSLIDMTGTLVSMYPDYVTVGTGNPGEMIFGSGSDITAEQQTKLNVWTNKTITDGNRIYIDQVGGTGNTVNMDQYGNKNLINTTISGSSNAITVKQGTPGTGQNEIKINVTGDSNTLDIRQARDTQGTGVGTNNHYQNVEINGYQNTVITQQSNTGGVGGHYMETTINGNQNNITARQTDNGNKIMFTSISGSNNSVEAIQKGNAQHYLDTKITGNNNSVSALQEGATANKATLDLTNAGGPASVILQQNGGQNVTITTTCATAGGCAPITVRQGY